MKITDENYEELKVEMKNFLIKEINKRIKESGTGYRLSLKIGKVYSHVDMVMKRGSFSALERLYKEIKEKELTETKELK